MTHPVRLSARLPGTGPSTGALWTACLLLMACKLSWAGSPGDGPLMEPCTPEQTRALVSALNKPAFAPRKVEVSLDLGECYQTSKDNRMLAFAVFIPDAPYPHAQAVSEER